MNLRYFYADTKSILANVCIGIIVSLSQIICMSLEKKCETCIYIYIMPLEIPKGVADTFHRIEFSRV